ncbi:chorismate lyase [Parashewanella spongiae]|uniref:Probable chorismate pyruvate-lyase n=1 Tax=Parashewanella spongiae TaxID=342950 RepID=A0A3A6TRR3_9GAMM|nr:chorismate lyase [Parashewanella spongiae]MCL1077139.1 chorismate lyase [Parashewanella spongiae]RJY18838.1 chorismate lyase [Parashewanella spongiae]
MSLPHPQFPVGEPINWSALPEDIGRLDDNLTKWLLATGSLTEKLKACCTEFQVEVLGEAELPSLQYESSISTTLWVREVLLLLDGVPWVFARTLIPPALLRQTQVDFKGLGTQPLGQLLFSHHEFVPGKIEIGHTALNGKVSQLSTSINQPCDSLWGRRRFFTYKQHEMQVCEFFLPAAINYMEAETARSCSNH